MSSFKILQIRSFHLNHLKSSYNYVPKILLESDTARLCVLYGVRITACISPYSTNTTFSIVDSGQQSVFSVSNKLNLHLRLRRMSVFKVMYYFRHLVLRLLNNVRQKYRMFVQIHILHFTSCHVGLILFPYRYWDFLACWEIISFQRRNVFHVINKVISPDEL